MNNPEISLIKNEDIDRQKWTKCVDRSSIPVIYAYPEYLDLVFPGWNGLIWGDYDFVMPLTVRRKLGMSFLLQPFFAQQHGIFPDAPFEIQTAFLNYIRDQFSYIAIHLNASHNQPFPKEFEVTVRQNMILNLNLSYDEIHSQYSKHALRLIKKAENQNVFVIKGLQTMEYIRLKDLATDNQLSKKSMRTLWKLIEYGYLSGKGTIYAAYNETNTLCSAAFFMNEGQRVVYLNAASTSEGKQNSSMYRIVDSFIRENSGSSLTLDFEGSSIPGIARFYEGFGAVQEQYYFLKINRLPIPFRWMKR